jgi:DNA-binding MarR family transcriptional regulator
MGRFAIENYRSCLHLVTPLGKYVNMTDRTTPTPPLSADEVMVRHGIELLFFAYRDFTGEADAILAEYGFGRAHHRVIYFVGRHAGISVSELLDILRITKQSLARVLGQLIEDGFIVQRPGPRDRRQRLLALTERGRALEARVTARQAARIARACAEAGPGAAEGFERVLLGLIEVSDRGRFVLPPPDEG